MGKGKGKTSLWAKLMGCIVLPVMLLVVVLATGGIAVSMGLQIEDARLLNAELVDTIGKNFDEMNLSVKDLFNLITMDEELQALLQKGQWGTITWMEDNVDIKRIVSNKALLMDNIQAIYLFNAQGRMRTFWHRKTGLGPLSLYPQVAADWFAPGGRVASRMDGNRLLYLRQINSMENLAPIGYGLLIYDAQAFGVQFDKLIKRNERTVIILDANGDIVTHNSASQEAATQIAQAVDRLGPAYEGRGEVPQVGAAIIAQYTSPTNGWRTLSVVAVDQVVRTSALLVKWMVLLGVGALALGAGICAILVRRQIIRPVGQIIATMRRVDEGDYTQRLVLRTGDELEELASSINEMLSRTDNLINQVLKDKLLHKELQLAALQAQINPHLLHNALECINWLAEFGRKEEIRAVTLSLSKLMQSLTAGPRRVPLAKELEYTRCFLSIYEILLENRLSYTIECNVATEMTVPRLTIQPLVENAVIHGVKQSLSPGHISISVSDTRQGVLISVFDDGVGMDEGQVQTINDLAQGRGGGENLGVGLRNVIQRLRLLYGEEATLHCTSDPGWGTLIDLVLPYGQKEAWDEEGFDCG